MSRFNQDCETIFAPIANHGEMVNQGHIDHVNALLEEAAQQDNHLLKSGKTVDQAVLEYLDGENV